MNFIHDGGNGVLTNDEGEEVVEYQMEVDDEQYPLDNQFEVILGFKVSRKAFKGAQGKREDTRESL